MENSNSCSTKCCCQPTTCSDESRYFQPAASQNIFSFGGYNLGITICEDIWNDKTFWAKPLYDRDPVAELVAKRASLIINISGSPYTIDKRSLRLDMLRALAKSHTLPVVYVNQVGGNDSLVFDGGSVVVLPDGRIAAQASSFEEDLILFRYRNNLGRILHQQPADEIDLVLQALVCGTRDYVRKSGFRAVVVGLSGGIDSSVVAAIAVAALGPENVLGVSMPSGLRTPPKEAVPMPASWPGIWEFSFKPSRSARFSIPIKPPSPPPSRVGPKT